VHLVLEIALLNKDYKQCHKQAILLRSNIKVKAINIGYNNNNKMISEQSSQKGLIYSRMGHVPCI
jgi:hypothetical protein